MNQFVEDHDPYGLYSADDTPVSYNMRASINPAIKEEEITQMNIPAKPISRIATNLPCHSKSKVREITDCMAGTDVDLDTSETPRSELSIGHGITEFHQDDNKAAVIEGIRIGVGTHEYSIRSLGTNATNNWVAYSECANCLELIYDFHGRMEDELSIPFDHIADIPKVRPPTHPDWLQSWQDLGSVPFSSGFLQLERVGLMPRYIKDKITKDASIPLAQHTPSCLILKPTLPKDQKSVCKICTLLNGYQHRIPQTKVGLGGIPLSSAATVAKVDEWLRTLAAPSPPPSSKDFTSHLDTCSSGNTLATPQISYIQSSDLKKVLFQRSAIPGLSLNVPKISPWERPALPNPAVSRQMTKHKRSTVIHPLSRTHHRGDHLLAIRQTAENAAFNVPSRKLSQSSTSVTRAANPKISVATVTHPSKARQLISPSSSGPDNLASLNQSQSVCLASPHRGKRERMLDNSLSSTIDEHEACLRGNTQMLSPSSEPIAKKPCLKNRAHPCVPPIVKDEQLADFCSQEVDWRYEVLHDHIREDLERGKSIEFALATAIPYEID